MRIIDPEFRLRQAYRHLWTPKLGLRLGTHKPTLRLSDYLHADAAPPAAVLRPHPDFQWGMLANDHLGDCVIAMMLHSIEDFHLDAGTPMTSGFQDRDAIQLYSDITGYNPSDPSTDQGTDEGAAVNYWRDTGLLGHKIFATVAVDPKNLDECRIAIDEFVDLQIGINLPLSAQGQKAWSVVGDGQTGNSAPGSWGGHGIPFREFDADTFHCVTWGSELSLTTQFHQTYTSEAHVVVSQEMLNKNGFGPSGVDWTKLTTDIKNLTPAAA